MLHNIYPTMKHLFKWKIKETDKCDHCGEIETLKHAVFECSIAKDAFKKLGLIVTEMYLGGQDDSANLNMVNILFGICCGNNFNNLFTFNQRKSIDKFIILTKQRLILQRENKIFLEYDVIKGMIQDYINIENYNKKKYTK